MQNNIPKIAIAPQIGGDGNPTILPEYLALLADYGAIGELLKPDLWRKNTKQEKSTHCVEHPAPSNAKRSFYNAYTQEELAALLDGFSGVLFPGGDDINPHLYGQEPLPTTQPPLEARDTFELALFHFALENNFPILGICRGAQLINVALGGTLSQDIQTFNHDSLEHQVDGDRCAYVHSVNVEMLSWLNPIDIPLEYEVNSIHHQAIGKLGEKLRCIAKAEDGIIEAIQLADKSSGHKPFCVGVQWHPEYLRKDPGTQLLMDAFVYFCKSKHTQKLNSA